jgi:chaperone BCS1
VSLSGLLNAIDGICSQVWRTSWFLVVLADLEQEDSVLFASTNHFDELDEALVRPGRFDVHVTFGYATHEQAAGLYKHFYTPPIPSPISAAIEQLSSDPKPLDELNLDKAANEFASIIVEAGIKVSLATLQGFLLLYKRDPALALDKAQEWADEIRLKDAEVTREVATV